MGSGKDSLIGQRRKKNPRIIECFRLEGTFRGHLAEQTLILILLVIMIAIMIIMNMQNKQHTIQFF